MKWIIREGNLTGLACVLSFLFGFCIILISMKYVVNYSIEMILISIGMTFMAIGGYSAKAFALHLRVFGKSPWRIAKDTYKVSPEDDLHAGKSESDDRKS